MNHYKQFFLTVACLVLSFSCASDPNMDNGPDLTAEVQSFLASYPDDLRTPNRERIVQRQNGELRIPLEDEASKSATTPAEACEPKARE